MNIKDQLQSVLCDPSGKVVIDGTDEDKRIIQDAIERVGLLENALSVKCARIVELENQLG